MTEAARDAYELRTLEDLRARYAAPKLTSLVKELDALSDDYRAFVEKAPFCALATAGPDGLDVSPRGDPAPVVPVLDRKTLALPDRRGNNRIDSLENIVRDPRVALLFLVPGIGDALRVNGRAKISIAPDLLQRFAIEGKEPRSVVVVTIDAVYFQCRKAIARSGLWDPAAQIPREALPSTGTMLQRLDPSLDGAAYDRDYPERMKRTIY